MYEAQQQRQRRLGRLGDLSAQQQQLLLAAFLLRGVVCRWGKACLALRLRWPPRVMLTDALARAACALLLPAEEQQHAGW